MRTVPTLLAAAVLGLALVPSQAHAATADVTDPVDDGVPAQADLTFLHVVNGPHRVRIDLTVREARPDKANVYAVVIPGEARHGYIVGSKRTRTGHRSVFVDASTGDGRAVPCRGLRVSYELPTQQLHLRIPRACLHTTYSGITVYGITENRQDDHSLDDTSNLHVPRGRAA